MITIIAIWVLLEIMGTGQSMPINWYLAENQILRVSVLNSYQDKYHILAEIKPGKIRYLTVKTKNQQTDLKVGYYYRYCSGRLETLPIGCN